MSKLLSFEALQVLDAIERKGSFASAAESLGRAPSSLSYQVQKLEQDLDLIIFDRSGHRAAFTDSGKLLLERGRLLLSAADEMIADATALAHGWELDVTIAYDGLLPVEWLFPLVDALAEKSQTRLKFQSEVLAGGWEALLQERADILIIPATAAIPNDVKTRFWAVCEIAGLRLRITLSIKQPIRFAWKPDGNTGLFRLPTVPGHRPTFHTIFLTTNRGSL